MRKNKYSRYLNFLLGLFVIISSLSLVSSALGAEVNTTIIAPAPSSDLIGVVALNISVNNSVAGNFSCAIYGKSTLTANNSWNLITILSNNTAGGSGNFSGTQPGQWVNGSFDSNIFEDANNYQINATCFNDTTKWLDHVISSMTVQNSYPHTPTSLSPTSDDDGSVTFSASVDGENVTSCTLYFLSKTPGATSYSMTHSGDTCSYSLSGIPEESYDWYVISSDETNTSTSATQTLLVDVPSSTSRNLALLQSGQVKEGKEPNTLSVAGDSIKNKNTFSEMVRNFFTWIKSLFSKE